MDPDIPWQEVYRRLIEEAPFIPGDAGESIEGHHIKWANPKLLEEGQIFFSKNGFSINLAHSAALILGFSIKNLSTVLLRTGNFNGTVNSTDRYIDTEDHLTAWYKSDIFHQYGDGHKGVQVVRKMHSMALRKCLSMKDQPYAPDESGITGKEEKLKFIQAMKDDLQCVDTTEAPLHLYTYNPKVLMSQFDMALTQYGFFALMYMYPDSFGIYNAKELDGLVHLWAVLGRLIGVQDRYNLALYPNRELYAKIHDMVGVACFKDVDLTSASLQYDFAEALGRMMHHNLSAPALFYFSFNSKTSMPQYQGDAMYSLLSWKDVILTKLITLLLLLMCNFAFVNRAVNDGFPIFAAKNREKVLTERKKRMRKML